MKKFTAQNCKEIQSLLLKNNFCHDASIIEVKFSKLRYVEDGSLVYPMKESDINNCTIGVSLLIDGDERIPSGKLMLFNFYEVKAFNFSQKERYDYSDLYEISFKSGNPMIFTFLATEKKVAVLTVECNSVDFEEKMNK